MNQILTLKINQIDIKSTLRNEQQTNNRINQQIDIVKMFSQDFHPNILQCYNIKSTKNIVENGGIQPVEQIRRIINPKIITAKQTQMLDQYLKKQHKSSKNLLLIVKQLIQAIKYIHENNCAFILNLNPKNIYVFIEQGEITVKIGIHNVWKNSKPNINVINNNKQLLKSMSPTLPQLNSKSDMLLVDGMTKSDIWNVGILILNILWTKQEIKIDFSQGKYNLNDQTLQNLQKMRYSQTTMKKWKFPYEEQCINTVLDCLWILPQNRTTLDKLQMSFRKSQVQSQINISTNALQNYKDKFITQKQNIQKSIIREISQGYTLLTQQLKKKLIIQFQSKKKKVLTFEGVFKASVFKFSCKSFHQKCDSKSNLLVIVHTKENKKFSMFTPVPFDLEKTNGIFGSYQIDEEGLAFIYSSTYNQVSYIKDRTKCIGNSQIHGPIFGECDIIIGDRNILNICKFPKSFQAPKNTKMKLTDENFIINEYEVYQVNFEQQKKQV